MNSVCYVALMCFWMLHKTGQLFTLSQIWKTKWHNENVSSFSISLISDKTLPVFMSVSEFIHLFCTHTVTWSKSWRRIVCLFQTINNDSRNNDSSTLRSHLTDLSLISLQGAVRVHNVRVCACVHVCVRKLIRKNMGALRIKTQHFRQCFVSCVSWCHSGRVTFI